MDILRVLVADVAQRNRSTTTAIIIPYLRTAGADVYPLHADDRAGSLELDVLRELYLRPVTIAHFLGGLAQSNAPEVLRRMHTMNLLNPTRIVIAIIQQPVSGDRLCEQLFPDYIALNASADHDTLTTLASRLAEVVTSPCGGVVDQQSLAAHEWLIRGRVCNLQGQPDVALVHFSTAASLFPTVAAIRANLAYTHTRLGHWEEGIRLGWELMSAMSLSCAGQCHTALYQYDKALAAYGRALAKQPHYHAALLGQGQVFLKLGRNEEAKVSLLKATVQTEESDPWAYEYPRIARHAWLYLMDVYAKEGDQEKASDAASKASKLPE